jgi:hypothetical protein
MNQPSFRVPEKTPLHISSLPTPEPGCDEMSQQVADSEDASLGPLFVCLSAISMVIYFLTSQGIRNWFGFIVASTSKVLKVSR